MHRRRKDKARRSTDSRVAADEVIFPDRQFIIQTLLLLCLATVICLPALNGGFIWDDGIFTSSEAVQGWDGLKKIWSSAAENGLEVHFWPITYTSYWIEHKLWGLNPAGYRLVNCFLHAINVFLVWRLLVMIGVRGAFFAAAIFAIHPVHIESAAWAMGRKDLLSGLFFFLAAFLWFRFDDSVTKRHRWLMMLCSLLLYAAAILSKTTAVTLPVGLLIVQWWRRGKLTRSNILETVPFFLLGTVMAIWDTVSANSLAKHEFPFTFLDRVTLAARALATYVERVVAPVELVLIYPRWTVDAGELSSWIAVSLLAATGTALWFLRQRIGRGWFAAAAFYIATLAPVLGFVDFGYMRFTFVADRYQYIALIAPAAVFGVLAALLKERLTGHFRRTIDFAVATVIVTLGVLSWNQASLFKSELSLFGHVTEINPKARGAHQILAKAVLAEGRREDALGLSRIAIDNRADDTGAHAVASIALYELGRDEEAIYHLEEVLRYKPQESDAMFLLAKIAERQGRDTDAAGFFDTYLKLKPGNQAVRLSLSEILLRLDRNEEAYSHATAGLSRLAGGDSSDGFDVAAGLAAYSLGRLETASDHFTRALAERRTADTLARLGQIRFEQNRLGEALALFKEQLDLDPSDAYAHVNIAAILANLGQIQDALDHVRRALEIDPENEFARTTMNKIFQHETDS